MGMVNMYETDRGAYQTDNATKAISIETKNSS